MFRVSDDISKAAETHREGPLHGRRWRLSSLKQMSQQLSQFQRISRQLLIELKLRLRLRWWAGRLP